MDAYHDDSEYGWIKWERSGVRMGSTEYRDERWERSDKHTHTRVLRTNIYMRLYTHKHTWTRIHTPTGHNMTNTVPVHTHAYNSPTAMPRAILASYHSLLLIPSAPYGAQRYLSFPSMGIYLTPSLPSTRAEPRQTCLHPINGTDVWAWWQRGGGVDVVCMCVYTHGVMLCMYVYGVWVPLAC